MPHSSVALLVDGDNVTSAYAEQILRKTQTLGTLQIRRVNGRNSSLTNWSSAPSFRQVVANEAKNSADILLSIEAMQFALRDRIDAFAIVSSDRDFSHAAHALREMGHHVLGLGETKAPREFRFACSVFKALEEPKVKVSNNDLSDLDTKIRATLESVGKNGIPIVKLSNTTRTVFGIKISEQPEKKWPRYLRERPKLYTITGEGQTARVHITTEA